MGIIVFSFSLKKVNFLSIKCLKCKGKNAVRSLSRKFAYWIFSSEKSKFTPEDKLSFCFSFSYFLLLFIFTDLKKFDARWKYFQICINNLTCLITFMFIRTLFEHFFINVAHIYNFPLAHNKWVQINVFISSIWSLEDTLCVIFFFNSLHNIFFLHVWLFYILKFSYLHTEILIYFSKIQYHFLI